MLGRESKQRHDLIPKVRRRCTGSRNDDSGIDEPAGMSRRRQELSRFSARDPARDLAEPFGEKYIRGGILPSSRALDDIFPTAQAVPRNWTFAISLGPRQEQEHEIDERVLNLRTVSRF